MEYLERGTHFVILTSVEEGSLTKRIVRELKNLLEFDYTDLLPSEIKEQTGLLEGDEANQFIQSTESYMRGFKETIKNDVKDYIKVLKENLKDQNFADDVLSKLVEETQNLKNQVRNREKVLAQIDAQIKALGEI
ncbi:ATP/GTP-binding protein [Helicobacter pylori SNT49]|uniref:ATP/GTP-binding protein n=1 Tax=Helicobacter pylori SNT49 TaxID=1055530 RepID=G2MFA3_HELPX|nr:ATP/GTP-binding protein [Helicobacter pylori SNT49]